MKHKYLDEMFHAPIDPKFMNYPHWSDPTHFPQTVQTRYHYTSICVACSDTAIGFLIRLKTITLFDYLDDKSCVSGHLTWYYLPFQTCNSENCWIPVSSNHERWRGTNSQQIGVCGQRHNSIESDSRIALLRQLFRYLFQSNFLWNLPLSSNIRISILSATKHD